MSDAIPLAVAAPTPTLARRVAHQALAFSVALLSLLVLSRLTVLPRLTRVPLQGSTLTVEELLTQERDLTQEVERLEQKRRQLLLPSDDRLVALREVRQERLSALDLQTRLEALAQSVTPAEARGGVTFETIDYRLEEGLALITGQINGVGPGSMTVLASFVDALRADPLIASVPTPAFQRDVTNRGDFVTPFALELHLARP